MLLKDSISLLFYNGNININKRSSNNSDNIVDTFASSQS